jgi:hypothetical protein
MTKEQAAVKIVSLQAHLEKTQKQLETATSQAKIDMFTLEIKRTKNKIESLKF